MNNSQHKISVVVPVFNELKNIDALIERLTTSLSTTLLDFEIIFIDDHSTDGTFQHLASVASKNVFVFQKVGKSGKAHSLYEGFQRATGTLIAMIDGDLQYPPEAIPNMVSLLETSDIVVANRKKYQDSFLRRTLSKTFRTAFGKLLFGLHVDIQSGLKIFTREVMEAVIYEPKSGWTFDLEFLHRAHQAGFIIKPFDIPFVKRSGGKSKVNVLAQTLEIGLNAMRLKFRKTYPMTVMPTDDDSMIGAGMRYKKQKYVTHTTLPHAMSAIRTFEAKQKVFIFLLLGILTGGFVYNPLLTAQILVAVLSSIYFIDVLFNLYIILRSLYGTEDITFVDADIKRIDTSHLPMYTILCPLYKEAHIIPHFLKSIDKLEWPKDKLEVMLLLEEDDVASVQAVKQMDLPSYVRLVVVPDSMPKTKPKACNYGLALARGEYLVIYDAEDMPDPDQLKKAFYAFQTVPKNVICLQAKLNYYNPSQNLLTRFFTAEYSLWFDITLTGLQSLETALPLGGTSNHFRTKDLLRLQGWDPFNVTEDADLGVRLFKEGFRTAIIDSTTLEEANSNYKNWLRQRSRWIKGYMLTYLVHLRQTMQFVREQGRHAFIFQLLLGGKLRLS